MKKNIRIFAIVSLIACGVIATIFSSKNDEPKAEQFIVKKPKRVSTSSLKEQIGVKFGQLLKRLSRLIATMAECSDELIDRTGELLDDQCSATSVQLQKYLEELETFEKKLSEFEGTARYMHNCLQDGLPQKKN